MKVVKTLGKKVISLLLVLCLTFSMAVMVIPTASAGVGEKIGKKAIELGLRFACSAATELAAQAEDDDASIVVQSFIQYVICDGTSASVNEIKAMCKKILSEMVALKADIKEYTSIISAAITNSDFNNAKVAYNEKWEEDITNVLNPKGADAVSVSGAFNAYIKYYIASHINANGMPETDEASNQLKAYWKEHFHEDFTEANYSATRILEYKQALEDEFLKIHVAKDINNNNRDSARATAYNSAYVYLKLTNTIDELVDNYLADDVGTNDKVYTVADSAATDAYYRLPFGFQQRDFIEKAAKDQIMIVTLMEMCLNEYLAFQGSYMSEHNAEGWNTQDILSYLDNSGKEDYMKYAECLDSYQDMLNRDLTEATYLMEADYKINTTAYTGVAQDIKVSLNDFMSTEDAQSVTLSINDFSEVYNYTSEVMEHSPHDAKLENAKQSYNKIPSSLNFYRVSAGDLSGKVYYILDPSQFDSVLDAKLLGTRVKRIAVSGIDDLLGDYYPVSVDYLNLIKSMTDGTNEYRVSSSANIESDLEPLINVPYFSSQNSYSLAQFFGSYLPQTKAKPYLITSNYDNNYNEHLGDILSRSAEVNLVDMSSTTGNNYAVTSSPINIEDMSSGQGIYTVLLAQTSSEDYRQKAKLTVNDNYNGVKSATISYPGGTISPNETATVKSGETVKIDFSLNSVANFDSLKLIRKNAKNTETILIDSLEELEYFKNSAGTGYSYELAMPYSEVEVVLTTKESDNIAFVEVDDPAGMVYAFAISDELTKEVIADVGEYADIKAGDNVTFTIRVRHADAFKSIVAVTNGKEKVVLSAEDFKATYNSSGFQYFTTIMPEGETRFILKTVDLDLYRAYAKTEDPADAVSSINVTGKYDSATMGTYELFCKDEPLKVSFSFKNINKFDSLVAVNRKTQALEVLVDSDGLAGLEKDGDNYIYNTTMPAHDIEFIVVSKQAEEFTPSILEQDENGTYIIYTYEDLRSVAYYVNTGDEKYTNGNYILANDINVLNRFLEPIGLGTTFAGSFDGQGHTISNFKILSNQTTGAASLFDVVSGEIKNLKLAGDYTLYRDGNYTVAYACGVARTLREGASVTNVQTNLNYVVEGFETISVVAGIARSADNNVTIERCIVNDTVNLPGFDPSYSGFIYTAGSNDTVNFINCANTSKVTLGEGRYAAGVMYASTWVNVNVTNCYVACDFSGDNLCPFVGAEYANKNVTNSYYLDSCIGDNSAYTDLGTVKNTAQFESGEVAYLLNSSVTDGTQVWYQNIDNGETPDTYPLFEGGTVYKSAGTCVSEGEGYTNNPGEITHNYNQYHVCKDCIGLRPGEAAGIYGFSIGLGGNISVQYYMVLDEDVAADETAKMVFTVPDTGESYTVEVPVSEATVSGKFHIFECEVAAKEIPSDIYCQVVTDTRESDVFRYSVKEYCEVILANPASFEKEIPLVKALLNYGAYAQVYFDYNTSELANTSVYITEQEKVLAQELDLSSYAYTLEGSQTGVSYFGSLLDLESQTAIRHYFYFENEEDVNTLEITINGEKATLVKNGGYYELTISDILAHRIQDVHEVKVGGLTLNYGIYSYGYKAMNTSNDKLKDVVKALYAYNQQAIEYRNS